MTKPTNRQRKAATFKPAFTPEKAADLDRLYEARWGLRRRLMLTILTRTKAQLTTGFCESSDGEALATAIELMADLKQHGEALAEMASSAAARLLLAQEARKRGGSR